MKTKRTLRTMKRAGLDTNMHGWVGTPTGNAVRRLAKQRKAEKRLAMLLPSPVFQALTVSGLTFRASIKALTLAAKAG
jgi:hypothetical protein